MLDENLKHIEKLILQNPNVITIEFEQQTLQTINLIHEINNKLTNAKDELSTYKLLASEL